jgi:phosphatidylserine decarboxylase
MLAWGGLLYFFRDPHRQTAIDTNAYYSPADGRIMVIDTLVEPHFIQGEARRISIFMSLTDVHVNRAPVKGEVVLSQHVPGKFIQAFREQASQVNEHHLIGVRTGSERILIKQIAGILARRVVCRVHPGDHLDAGERLGLIKFGSRVELFLPAGCEIAVRVGDRVFAGESILARKIQPRGVKKPS